MFLKHFIVRAGLLGFAFAVLSCAAASTGRLETGMTPDQAVQAMGQPDLKDAVPDPRGSGGTVVRYAWIGPGKLATFGADNRLAEIGDLPAGTAAPAAAALANTGAPAASAAADSTPPARASFDPIQTPLNYIFYPLNFGFTWLGAGVNCVAEGQCRKPEVKPPDAG